MGWKDKMAEYGGVNVTFLSEDGETIRFVVCGDPNLIVGKFKGSETKRIAFPIMCEDGFTMLVVGMRVARRLTKHEASMGDHAFIMTRHGEKNDQNATYDLGLLPEGELPDLLFEMKAREFDASEVPEALHEIEKMLTT